MIKMDQDMYAPLCISTSFKTANFLSINFIEWLGIAPFRINKKTLR